MARKKAADGQDRAHTKKAHKQGPHGWHRAFLVALAKEGNITAAARKADTARSTVWDARQADPAFDAACLDALEEFADNLETEAKKRATTGKDTTLLIFLLKGARPEKYRDRAETRHTGGLRLGVVEEIVDA